VECPTELVEKVKELEEIAFKKLLFAKGMFFEVPGEYQVAERWMK
jgi:hypothetical protein